MSKIKKFSSIFVNSLSFNNLNQYLVSLAALDEIDIFAVKSFLSYTANASSILDPIEVPLLKI